jgi:hypothetical protein
MEGVEEGIEQGGRPRGFEKSMYIDGGLLC